MRRRFRILEVLRDVFPYLSILCVALWLLAAGCPRALAGEELSRPPRIVSLVPEATEIICLLDAGECLAGVTRFDSHFAGCGGKPLIGGDAVSAGAAISAARPELLIVDRASAGDFTDLSGVRVLPWESGGGVRDAERKIALMGSFLERGDKAEAVLAREWELLATLRAKVAKLPEDKRLRGMFVFGRDVLMTVAADDTPNAILAAAGILPPEGLAGAGEVTISDWLRTSPEIILAESRDREDLSKLFGRSEWRDVPAVRDGRVYYFPEALTRRSAGHIAYMAAWLSSLAYTDLFADSSLLVHTEEILGERPLHIDLPYVAGTRVVESRIGDFIHRTLLIDFTGAQTVLSTNDGHRTGIATIGNSFSPTPMWAVNHQLGMAASRDNVLRVLGLGADCTSLLFTGADMNNLALAQREADGIRVVVLATAGVESNALRMSRDTGAYVEPGTINIIVMTNRRLGPGAMANAIVSVTEAKTAALWDMDVRSSQTPRENPATGTGTDGVLIVQGEGGAANWVGGHARLGQLLAEAVHEAVQAALLAQNGLAPVRHPFARLEERRVYPERVFNKEPDDPFMRRFETLLMNPRYRGFLESTMVLDDAHRMGQLSDPVLFETWALGIAGEIAGREVTTLPALDSGVPIPPLLSIALAAFAAGIDAEGEE